MKTGLVALALSTLVTLGAFGCAAPTDAADPAAGDVATDDDNEVKSNVLGDVHAVKVQGRTVGAKTKVSKILRLTGLSARAAKPDEGAFRCMPTYRLEFLDARGETIASGGFMCGAGGEPTSDAKGYITLRQGGKAYLISGDAKAIDELSKAPLQVADVTYGVDKIELGRPGQAGAPATEKADLTTALKALGTSQVPDPNASFPRCLPNHVVTLYRAGKHVATASFLCGGAGGTDVQASFSSQNGEEIHGAIRVDATALIALEDKLRAAPR